METSLKHVEEYFEMTEIESIRKLSLDKINI